MRLKDMAVGVFSLIATDKELLDLLEVPVTLGTGGIYGRSMKDIKEQIIEDRYPNDLVQNNLTRLCVYELPTQKGYKTVLERSYLEVDVYVNKDKNKMDRRNLLIADRLFRLLNNKNIEDFQLYYNDRLPNLATDNSDWSKYGLVFSYDNIII